MCNIHSTLPLAATLALSLALAGCGGDDNTLPSSPTPTPPTSTPAPTPTPSPTPTPTPTPTPPPVATLSVSRCLSQEVGPGQSVASLVIPDTIQIRLNQAPGFPNGRRLADSVVDITLAVILLDLSKHPATTFVSLPLNPPMNDRPFLADFPFMAPPQGAPPIASAEMGRFRFRDDAPSAYVRVDRTGMPAVSTALISGPLKNAFNDDGPVQDVSGRYVQDITTVLTTLHTQLRDDFATLGLSTCAS